MTVSYRETVSLPFPTKEAGIFAGWYNGSEEVSGGTWEIDEDVTLVAKWNPKRVTTITITDKEGNTISWASSGTIGYKGAKKKTPYAAGLAAEAAGKQAMDSGVVKVEVFVKGLGGGRETAIRSLQAVGLEITSINDETPVPHNGCRPPKRPRN